MSKHFLKVQHDPENGPTLVPDDQPGWDWLTKKKHGQVIQCEVRAPRNIDHHRKFFALLNLVFENQSHYKSVDDILLAFKYHIGHGHWVFTKGRMDPIPDDLKIIQIFQPHSISFAKMGQDEFAKFYSDAMDFVCTVVIPNMDSEALEQELMGFV